MKKYLFLLLAVASITLSQAQLRNDVKQMSLGGVMGQRMNANTEQWMLTAPYANPGMLEMYNRRNDQHQIMVKWYGEFSGKYLTSAALIYSMTRDERLLETINYVVEQLAKVQDKDGYLGVWPDHMKLTGYAPGGLGKTWDAWSHYHNILGLYYCYKLAGNDLAREVMLKAADCLYQHFGVEKNLIDEDKDGTDSAIGHTFALLYQLTGEERYRQMIDLTFDTFASEQGGDYYRAGLAGTPFFEMKRHRWECLHAIELIREMERMTGEADYRTAFTNIWKSVQQFDRHNTGGFSSGEAACGNPYDTRAIETCCTIAWMALCVDMLDMCDDSRVADELELSTWNALIGAQHPSGRNFTYNTPMLGDKKASGHNIVFQAIAGSSELNCCSVNGPRGFGMISQWGMLVDDNTLTINYYGESTTTLNTANGKTVTVTQTGGYPFDGNIALNIKGKGVKTLRLRIPEWSRNTVVTRGGTEIAGVKSGKYLVLENVKGSENISIKFDMTPRFWYGERNLEGNVSIYQGPILLTLDQRFDAESYNSKQPIDVATLKLQAITSTNNIWPEPVLLVKATDQQGHTFTLCDFASAGQTGTSYTTWIPLAK